MKRSSGLITLAFAVALVGEWVGNRAFYGAAVVLLAWGVWQLSEEPLDKDKR